MEDAILNVCRAGDEFTMLDMLGPSTEKLPFEVRKVKAPCGGEVECYVIPDEQKEDVLEQLYPFMGVPSLDARLFDLHQQAMFTVRDYLVIRRDGKNYLVSPYFSESGGTVLDWLDDAEQEVACRMSNA